MGKDNRRQMGSVHNSQRAKIGLTVKTEMGRGKTNICRCKTFTYYSFRSRKFIRKGCDKTCSTFSDQKRFLQYIFPCAKENRRFETNNKSSPPKQVHSQKTFSHGYADKSVKLSQTKRLGNISRSEGCLSACPNSQISQKISSFLHTRQSISVCSTLFWPNPSTSLFYEDSFGSNCTSENAECSSSFISRRLVNSKSNQKSTPSRSRDIVESSTQIGIHNKLGEVCLNSQPDSNIHRSPVQFSIRNSASYSREGTKIMFSSSQINEQSQFSSRFFAHSRSNGLLYRISSQCQTIYETHTITSPPFLETNHRRIRNDSSCYTTPKATFTLVVKPSQHYKGQIISPVVKFNNYYHRCIQNRLWGPHEQSVISGHLDQNRSSTAHQYAGIRSCLSYNSTFSSSTSESERSFEMRQYHSSTIYQQARGDQICQSLLQSLGTVQNDTTPCNTYQGGPFIGPSKFVGRPAVTSHSPPNRMDPEQSSSGQTVLLLGETNDRPVCFRGQQQNADFLHMVSIPESLCDRCSVNSLEQHGSLCISSNLSCSQSSGAHVSVPLSDTVNSTSVAKTPLVHKSVTKANRLSKKTSHTKQSSSATQNNDLPSNTRDIQSHSMAAFNRNFKNKGFSKETRKLLTASWRAGTQQDYACKFKKFNSWCRERQKDPYSATLVDCADFLTYLFNSGLQYRTIAGYRSMLSSVLLPIDNTPVGQHPYIIRLLKGVFNSRPPVTKLLPEWDLFKVLDLLQKSPFEPLKHADLKYVTFKTVFLIAITTFRRCSDLQALRIGEDAVKIQNRGVTFIRTGLSKQDRPGHIGNKIFVPCYKDNKKLDPKRALYHYLKKTESIRGETQCKLFLSIVKPHQPVSRQTIAKWIVKTIRLAYDKDVKVKAHSTRAIGPSWALFKGASMHSILDAADWSRESTFTKFYLRDVEVKVLN